jgi:hypothetical protein
MNSKRNKLPTLLVASLFGLIIFVLSGTSVQALSGSQFNPGRIIDDDVFFNPSGMSATEIQRFLNAKVPVCDTNHARTSSPNDSGPPYTCLKSYSQNTSARTGESGLCSYLSPKSNRSAANIIYDVALACGINPKVLIVLLQKEQSLITDTWPWDIQYRSATGYGCPDTAPCDSEYYGFFNQVYMAARQFKRYAINEDLFKHRAQRNNNILYNPNAACGSSTVFIQNQATAGLYNYTPYQPNQAALNNLYGSGDGCSAYGNRNFWRMYNDWFGSTEGTPFFRLENGRAIYMIGADNIYYHVPNNSVLEAYGYWRTVHKVRIVPSSYLNGKTYSGRLGQAAQFESEEIYFVSSGKLHHVPNLATLSAFGQKVSQFSASTKYFLTESSQKASTVFKKPSDTKIYVAEAGKKRHITNGEVYSTQGDPIYNQRNLSIYSAYFIDYITEGSPVFSEGATVHNTSKDTYSIYENGALRPAASLQIGRDWGLANTYSAPDSILNDLPTGAAIGRFVRDDSGKKYLIDSGKKLTADTSSDEHLKLGVASYTLVPSSFLQTLPTATFRGTVQEAGKNAVYKAARGELLRIYSTADFDSLGFKWNEILNLSTGFLASLTNAGGISFADGRLLQVSGQPEVYLVDNSGTAKRHVTSLSLLRNYGWSMSEVKAINSATASHYSTGVPLTNLVRDVGGTYWLFDSGKKWKIPTSFMSNNIYGFDFATATSLSSKNFNNFPIADNLTELIRDATDGRVYKIENGKKRWYTNRTSFERNNGNWGAVRSLSAYFVNSIPDGSPIN